MMAIGAPIVCVLCGSKSFHEISLNRSMGVFIFECSQCGLIQSEYLSDAALKEYYTQYYRAPLQPHEIDMLRQKSRAQAAAQLAYLESLLPKGLFHAALDYGAADGELARALKTKAETVYVTEPDTQYAEILKKESGIIFVEGERIETTEFNGFFDLITLSHVLEHLMDPMTALDLFSRLLKNDGFLLIDLPNEAEMLKKSDFQANGHLHYFTPETFRNLLERNGRFDIQEMHTCNRSIEAFTASEFSLPEQHFRGYTTDGTVIRCLLKNMNPHRSIKADPPKPGPDRRLLDEYSRRMMHLYQQLLTTRKQRNDPVCSPRRQVPENGYHAPACDSHRLCQPIDPCEDKGETLMIRTPIEAQNMTLDNRYAIYKNLHEDFLEKEEQDNRMCAETVLKEVFDRHFRPRSVLDVGCGLGTWLLVAQQLGAAEIFGIEGPWVNKNQLRIHPENVAIMDLENPFDLKRRFDLTLCLEVAEHLPEASAKPFVRSLVQHSEVVIFSAAIPFQGGHHHINEQWQNYWVELFADNGYRGFDGLRRSLWACGSVFGHIRQNLLVFVSDALSGNPLCKRLSESAPGHGPFAVVHPDTHLRNMDLMGQLMQIKKKYDAMMDLLMAGGTFLSAAKDKETLDLVRVDSAAEASRKFNDVGVRHYRDNRLKEAEGQFRLAIKADPGFAEPHNNLAVLLWHGGLGDQALAEVNEALRIDPDDPDTVLNLADICRASGKNDKAKEVVEAYLRRHPTDENAQTFLEEINPHP